MPKAESAARSIAAINPTVRVTALHERADAARLLELVADADVVIDCSDNFATRQAVNAACVAHARPLVAGAAIGFDGQLSVYDTRVAASPVLRLRVPARRVVRGRRLRDDGRVRAAGRHHRQHAGRRGAEADRRASARRSSGGCRCSTRARWSGPRCASPAIPAARVSASALELRAEENGPAEPALSSREERAQRRLRAEADDPASDQRIAGARIQAFSRDESSRRVDLQAIMARPRRHRTTAASKASTSRSPSFAARCGPYQPTVKREAAADRRLEPRRDRPHSRRAAAIRAELRNGHDLIRPTTTSP